MFWGRSGRLSGDRLRGLRRGEEEECPPRFSRCSSPRACPCCSRSIRPCSAPWKSRASRRTALPSTLASGSAMPADSSRHSCLYPVCRSWSGPTHGGLRPASACAWLWQPAQTSVCGCGNLHKGVCTLPQPHHFTLVDIDNYGRNIRITRAEHPHQKSYHVTHGALADTSAEAPAGRERQPG
jgi:hypothetical protein